MEWTWALWHDKLGVRGRRWLRDQKSIDAMTGTTIVDEMSLAPRKM